MLNTIVELLNKAKVCAWSVTAQKTRGWEFYFIRHALDQNRVRDVEHFTVTVYQQIEDGKYVGSASAELHPTSSPEEAAALIDSLAYRATLVKNEPFTLVPAYEEEKESAAPIDTAAIAADFLSTMKSLPETETEDINSYELFVSEKTTRVLNSNGLDVSDRAAASMLEVIVNARRGGHEIELYRAFTSGSCDAEGLRRELVKAMATGRDRLQTRPTPNLGKADVLFSTKAACDIYYFFLARLDAANIYHKFSDWQPGVPIAEDVRGDKVSVRTLRSLPNSSANARHDAEGSRVRETLLMEDDVPQRFIGSRRYSCYLGLEDSFIPGNVAFSGGTHTEEELRNGPYLEAVEFSDFQVDDMTGDVFGELRLGYWHDGEKVIPVSGGSVSGSMFDYLKAMEMSAAQTQYNDFLIPSLTLLRGVTVTGAEKEE